MAFGQVEAQEPALEWQQSSWSKDKPAGYELSFESWGNGIPGTVENTANYTATAHPAEPGLSREESGGDWLYKQVELHDANGYPIGYMAVGYTQFVNWVQDDQCQVQTVVLPRPDPFKGVERLGDRRGGVYGLLARYDLNGNQLWFKSFAPGIFFDIIQDSQNNIVVVGSASNLRSRAGVPDHTIRLNPPSAGQDPISDLAGHQCEAGRAGLMTVIKFDLAGNILWDHLYSPFDNLPEALTLRAQGHGLIETNINGEMGYKAVGFGTIADGITKQVFVVDLNSSGLVKTKTLYATLPGSSVADTFDSEAMRICKTSVSGIEYYAISGFRLMSQFGSSSAFLWVLRDNQHHYLKDTRDVSDFPGINQGLNQSSNGVCFQIQNGTAYVVWPMLANFTANGSANGQIYAGNHQAQAQVYKYDTDGNAPIAWPQPVDLGIARGFDLQFNATPTRDGHLAFATTVWSEPFVAPGTFYGWGNLSQPVQDYLVDAVDGLGYDATGPVIEPGLIADWENVNLGWKSSNGSIVAAFTTASEWYVYGIWNTDSYVAKLDGTTGTTLWDKQWDEGSGPTNPVWHGNFRKRQCNFDIIETYDGGLLVCGNEGHNYDDAYLAKLKDPCDFELEATIGHVCHPGINDGSVDLLVYGLGNYSYQWSNGATTEDISGLAPGTYSVIVTEQGGVQCAETRTFTVAAPMNGEVVYSPSCVTGGDPVYTVSVTDGGVGPFSFIWYGIVFEGHPPEMFHSGSSYTLHPGGTIPWSITAFDDGTGCQVEASDWEPIYGFGPHPTVLSTAVTPSACTTGITGGVDLNLYPAFEPYTFLWSNGATTEDLTGVEAGTYSVTISYGLTCSESYSYTVTDAAPCCPADLIIPNGAHSSDYAAPDNTYFNNTSLKILGIFHVDNNCFVNYTTIYMDPGAEIIVEPGANFILRNSQVEECNGVMWRSITVNHGSYLEMQRTTVKDGEYAVKALDGAAVLLFDNDFTDNRVCLYVPNTTGVTYNSVSTNVIGNRFQSTGTLAQTYPGQTTSLGSKGFAAVLAYKTSLDLSGYAGYNNTVDNMSNGIVGYNSDLRVARFDFKNVQPDGAYAVVNDGNGSGIFAYGRNGIYSLRQTGNGMQGQPSFQNCKWGIYTLSMNTDSRDNYMQAVGTGYRVDKARQFADIIGNRVSAKLHGMVFNQNAGTLHFWVQDNDIAFGTLTDPVPAPLCSGILVADGNDGGQDSRIEGNTITMMSYPLSTAGITLYPARNWLVAGNTISMTNNSFNRYGVANYGSSHLEVSCNTVVGAGTVYPQGGAALYSNMGDRLLFSCNDLDHTTNGLLFNGLAADVEVKGNNIRHHKYGLHLAPHAIIGTQETKGNLWFEQPPQGGLSAWYEPIFQGQDNYNAAANPFKYNPAIIGGGNTVPPSWEPNDWFGPSNLANYECSSPVLGDYCGQFHIARPGEREITDLDGLVAKDSLRNDPYTAESKWMLKDGLYKKIDDAPELLDGRPDMADFYAAMQGTATAAFKVIDDGRTELYNMDSTVVAQLQANNDEITALMDSVKVRMTLLEDSTLSEVQRAAVLAGILGFRESIRTLTTWNTTAMQLAANSKVLTAEGLKTANANIGTTELIETNRKWVDEIYLSTIGKDIDTFTVAQSADLLAIANQCPMLGGNAVYTARALYRLIDDTYAYDDQLLCLPHGIIVKRLVATEVNGDENGVTVVPNPTRDRAALVLDQPLDQAGSLVLYDLTGKEVMRVDIPEGESRTEFTTGALASGLYQYRVESGSTLLGHGKLAIVR